MKKMEQEERTLTIENVDKITKGYTCTIDGLGSSIAGKSGLRLLEALKREKLETGPYPGVTLFEAANRIMHDLVILYGVEWLLKNRIFPFNSYTVEFGIENTNGFGIIAGVDGKTLVGEAFNVAPAFFQPKKLSMLKKLRREGKNADYRIIMFNHDAVGKDWAPKDEKDLYYVVVNVCPPGAARVVPNINPQSTTPLNGATDSF